MSDIMLTDVYLSTRSIHDPKIFELIVSFSNDRHNSVMFDRLDSPTQVIEKLQAFIEQLKNDENLKR